MDRMVYITRIKLENKDQDFLIDKWGREGYLI